jgi:hypothetical protein
MSANSRRHKAAECGRRKKQKNKTVRAVLFVPVPNGLFPGTDLFLSTVFVTGLKTQVTRRRRLSSFWAFLLILPFGTNLATDTTSVNSLYVARVPEVRQGGILPAADKTMKKLVCFPKCVIKYQLRNKQSVSSERRNREQGK